jgi:DNA-binding transcriptional regulator YhcF (GntR family)
VVQTPAPTPLESPATLSDLGREDDVPVGIQLAWRLRALILSGRLLAGARLPGVRELAVGAGVNVNTARSIYRRLEDEGLAVSRHGLGTFVADGAAATPAIEHLAAEAAEAARASGISPRELAQTLYVGSDPAEVPTRVPEPAEPAIEASPGEGDRLAARRALRAQVARLEADLASYTEELGLEEARAPISEPTAHIADIGELEATRDALIARLRDARAAAEKTADREEAARLRLQAMVEDPAAHKWDVVSNEELGEPGCTTYEVRPAWGPVGALMNWWQIRVSGGCPLAGPPAAARG